MADVTLACPSESRWRSCSSSWGTDICAHSAISWWPRTIDQAGRQAGRGADGWRRRGQVGMRSAESGQLCARMPLSRGGLALSVCLPDLERLERVERLDDGGQLLRPVGRDAGQQAGRTGHGRQWHPPTQAQKTGGIQAGRQAQRVGQLAPGMAVSGRDSESWLSPPVLVAGEQHGLEGLRHRGVAGRPVLTTHTARQAGTHRTISHRPTLLPPQSCRSPPVLLPLLTLAKDDKALPPFPPSGWLAG